MGIHQHRRAELPGGEEQRGSKVRDVRRCEGKIRERRKCVECGRREVQGAERAAARAHGAELQVTRPRRCASFRQLLVFSDDNAKLSCLLRTLGTANWIYES